MNLFDSKVSLGNSNISLNSFGDLFEILQTAFRILYYIGAVNPTSESGIFPAQGLVLWSVVFTTKDEAFLTVYSRVLFHDFE